MGRRQGKRRLADAARAHHAHAAAAPQQLVERGEVVVATEQHGGQGRQVDGGRGHRRHGRCSRAFRRHHEPVAAPRDGHDGLRAEQLAQRRHVDGEIVLLDHDAGPHDVEQLVLGDHPVAALGQSDQHVEGARAQRGGATVDDQVALPGPDLEATETTPVLQSAPLDFLA